MNSVAQSCRIGTRGSPLALAQTGTVRDTIASHFPDVDFTLAVIKAEADRKPDLPIDQFGGKGLFIKEIEDALLRREIDLGIHSLKDMTAETTVGLSILAVSTREDPRDCLVSRSRRPLADLPIGATVGTSSLRRLHLLHAKRPDLKFEAVRGNVDTRIRKVKSGRYDAVVLAYAALKRLGLESEAVECFDPNEFIPAAGQGSLAIEGRSDDPSALRWSSPIQDPDAAACWRAEQSLLARLEGGCRVPLGAHAIVRSGNIRLKAFKGIELGRPLIRVEGEAGIEEAGDLGRRLAEEILTAENAEERRG